MSAHKVPSDRAPEAATESPATVAPHAAPRGRSVFAWCTGMHLAALQFGLLLSLQAVSSSAWQSYAQITAAWMGGSLLGLWLDVGARRAQWLGLLAFELAWLALRLWPFALWLPWLSALCAALCGVWAGGFFVVATAQQAQPGRLFFLENSGFALGMVAVALAFAFGGRDALALLPLVTFALGSAAARWSNRAEPSSTPSV